MRSMHQKEYQSAFLNDVKLGVSHTGLLVLKYAVSRRDYPRQFFTHLPYC